jgi:hypothetical protein
MLGLTRNFPRNFPGTLSKDVDFAVSGNGNVSRKNRTFREKERKPDKTV